MAIYMHQIRLILDFLPIIWHDYMQKDSRNFALAITGGHKNNIFPAKNNQSIA